VSTVVRPLVVDHYDSYTGSLVDLVARVAGVAPTVVQHDRVDASDLLEAGYTHVVLSPGPGHPDEPRDFSVGRELLTRSPVPILGVCLGHQGIVTGFGGTVARVAPAHGTVSRILHDETTVFGGLPQAFPAVRYHSLAAVRIPDFLRVTAWCESDEGPVVMGVAHRTRPIAGVQFHPESVLTDHGERLVANFLGTPPERPRTEVRRAKRPKRVPAGTAVRTLPWVEPADFFATHVADRPRAFWLDGEGRTEPGERFTYIGWARTDEPSLTFDAGTRIVREHRGNCSRVVGDDIFEVLDDRLACDHRPPADLPFAFQGGWVGYLGYACRTDLPSRKHAAGEGAPDACLVRAVRFLAFDHDRRVVHAVSGDEDPSGWFDEVARLVATTGGEPLAVPMPSALECEDLHFADYAAAFQRVREALIAGDTYEANLTYRVGIRSRVEPLAVFRALRARGPTPYAAFVRHRDLSVVSASPERFLLLDGDRVLESKPIKGTTPRGADAAEDAALRDALLTDPRFTAENLMVTDLVRHDLSTVCETGSVDVPALMRVENYSNVHQLVTTVRGRLRDDVTATGAIAALFPPASMTGAPKRRTMELIEEVESSPRGVYSGALGWIGRDRADLGVVIRTVTMVGDRVLLGTGGAITVHSDPQAEYDETRWKIDHLRGVLFDRGGTHIPRGGSRPRSPQPVMFVAPTRR
jgi:para-aminobenzoate synthetase